MARSLVLALSIAAAFTGSPVPADDPDAESEADETSPAVEPPSALEAFRAAQDEILALVRKGASDKQLERKVDAFLDPKWIAEQSLGGPARYKNRCAPRCAEFEALLTKLIRENYLRRIRQADRGTLEYLGEERRKHGTKAKVDTRVSFTNDQGTQQSLKISYVLHWVGGKWVARNIITDGVSLSQTYRYEFNEQLRLGGIDRLIAQLEGQLAALAKAD